MFSTALVYTCHKVGEVIVEHQSVGELYLEYYSEISTSISHCPESCPSLSVLLIINVRPCLATGQISLLFHTSSQAPALWGSFTWLLQAGRFLRLCLQCFLFRPPQGNLTSCMFGCIRIADSFRTGSLTHFSYPQSLTHGIHLSIQPATHPFIHLFTHLFTHSFVYSFGKYLLSIYMDQSVLWVSGT